MPTAVPIGAVTPLPLESTSRVEPAGSFICHTATGTHCSAADALGAPIVKLTAVTSANANANTLRRLMVFPPDERVGPGRTLVNE